MSFSSREEIEGSIRSRLRGALDVPLRSLIGRVRAELADVGASGSSVPYPQYAADPLGFFRDVLGLPPFARPSEPCEACLAAGKAECIPADQCTQEELVLAVGESDLVAVRAGQKVTKSTTAAGLALWWPLTASHRKVVMTAPTGHQIRDILWTEFRMLQAGRHPGQRNPLPLPGGTLNPAVDPSTGYRLHGDWIVKGKTAEKQEALSGISGDVLWIVDEASGYPEHLFEAIFGNMAGAVHCLLLSNPTQMSGTFYDAFHSKRSAWRCMHMSSFCSPNFHGSTIKGLASPAWHDRVAIPLYGGPGSPFYDARVLGEFPRQAVNSVCGIGLLEASQARQRAMATPDARLEIGLDVAREPDGDETIVVGRRGKYMFDPIAVRLDPELAISGIGGTPPVPLGHQAAIGCVSAVRSWMREHVSQERAERQKPRIKVDAIGNGTAALDYLIAFHSHEFEIVAVVVSKSAEESLILAAATRDSRAVTAKDRFVNLRAQLAFGLRDWMQEGGGVSNDPKLAAEAVAATYRDVGGRILIEAKDEIKARLRRSPDRCDAACMCVYEPSTVQKSVASSGSGWGLPALGGP